MTTLRVVAGLSGVAYVLVVAAILLNSDPGFATSVIAQTEQALRGAGAADWMTYGARVQMMLNALMFAPVTAFAALAFPRHPWGNWVAYSFMVSGAAEVFQALALEPRSAEYVDVVANTLGGLLGVLAVLPATAWSARSVRSLRSA